nr:unnamed protein product [Spirometra erinaceieuropaei]
MTIADKTLNRALTYAKTHYLCCKICTGWFFCVGLLSIIAGSVLAVLFRNRTKCSRVIFPDGNLEHLHKEDLTDINENEVMIFTCGLVLLAVGIAFNLIGSICAACVCCGRKTNKRKNFQPPPPPRIQLPVIKPINVSSAYEEEHPSPPLQKPPSYDETLQTSNLSTAGHADTTAPSAPATDHLPLKS